MPDNNRPVALVTVFSGAVLQRILDAVAAGPSPPIADWFIGTFGVNQAAAEAIAAVPGCRYAPVFCIQPRTGKRTRLRRRLSPQEAAQLPDTTHAGEIPGTSAGEVIPAGDRRAWGIELGRRFRDEMRSARARGIKVDAWQFDEVLGECGRPGANNPHRRFVGGVLRGLVAGRPRLGDRHEKGFVWAARTAVVGLPGLPFDGDVRAFSQDLSRAALFLVGEEYAEFTGDPTAVGRSFADGHQAFVRSGGAHRSLGHRYVVGMTPGWRPSSTGLGGNVDAKSPPEVTRWRNSFLDARIAAQRPRGFAQFNFVKENVRPNRVEDAVDSLHHACKQALSFN
jgi:hypothetical protein